MGKRNPRRQVDPERVALCAEWIIVGMRPSQVAAQAKKLGWDVDADELLDTFGEAYIQIIGEGEVDPVKENAKAVARLNMLYTRSIGIQDYKTALSVQKEINALVAKLSNPMLKGMTDGTPRPVPKPTKLKLLEGTRRDRINPAEPPQLKGDPEPPAYLEGPALVEWKRILPMLKQMKILSRIDGTNLAIYCTTYARWLEARDALKRFGLVTPTAGGSVKPSPYLAIEREAVAVMTRILSEFGGSPSARSRIKSEAETPENALEKFIKS